MTVAYYPRRRLACALLSALGVALLPCQAPAATPGTAAMASSAPASAPAAPAVAVLRLPGESALRCSGQAAAPASMTLQLGKSTLMRMPETVQSRSVGNPDVVQAILVAPDTLYVAGVDIGTSNMIVQGRSGNCSVIEVVVGIDPGAVRAALAELMPEQKNLRISAAGDTLVVSGSVDDAATAARVLELVAAFVRRPVQALKTGKGGAAAAASLSAPASVSGGADGAAAAGGSGPRVINLLNVSAPQQVMLEVKIAEVSKTLLDKLEINAAVRGVSGSWATSLLTKFVTGTLRGALDLRKSNGSGLSVEAEKQDGLVRILAEPTVMAISGQEGSFLAGGKIFIPVAQDNNKITLEEKEFGVGLRFTPTVLAGGRISLKVAPEVSELSREGVGISAAGISGSALMPLITTRRAATTVELFDGQSFAIGGLIKNNQTSNINGVPVLGELPVLGALFRSTDFQHDRTELLFVVTAHLVQPLPPNYALPTDSQLPPSRAGLFLGGHMEGQPSAAPVQPAVPAGPQGRGFELK